MGFITTLLNTRINSGFRDIPISAECRPASGIPPAQQAVGPAVEVEGTAEGEDLLVVGQRATRSRRVLGRQGSAGIGVDRLLRPRVGDSKASQMRVSRDLVVVVAALFRRTRSPWASR